MDLDLSSEFCAQLARPIAGHQSHHLAAGDSAVALLARPWPVLAGQIPTDAQDQDTRRDAAELLQHQSTFVGLKPCYHALQLARCA